MINPLMTYTGGGLQPVYGTEDVRTDAINLAGSKQFPQGTVLGQVPGSGSAVNEVQTITPAAAVTAGTFQYLYDGQLSAVLPYNATIAQCQAALDAMPAFGPGGCVAAGGPQATAATTYTFQGTGTTAGMRMGTLNIVASITGGPFNPTVITTPGSSANGYYDAYNAGASGAFAGLATPKRLLQYNVKTDGQGRHYFATDFVTDMGRFDRSAPAFWSGQFKTSDLVGLDANAVPLLGRLLTGSTATLSSPTTILRLS